MFELIPHRLALWLNTIDKNFQYMRFDLFRGSEGILSWTKKSSSISIDYKHGFVHIS